MNTPLNSGTCQASDAAEIQVQLWTAILALTVYIRVMIPVHMYMLVSWVLASTVAGGYPSLFNALLLFFLHGSMVKSTSSMHNDSECIFSAASLH